MKKLLFPKGNTYKANLHCHSCLSDGQMTPAQLKEAYKKAGYSVLAFTDHEGVFYHNYLDDEDFITLAGAEFEYNDVLGNDFNDWRVAHICVIKKDPSEIYQLGFDPEYDHFKFNWLHNEWRDKIRSKGEIIPKIYSPENINSMIKRYRDEGFLVAYNHPKWSCERYPEYSKYEGMNFMEIYNNGTYQEGHPEHNGDVYSDMLKDGKRVFPIATDDNHTPANMFGGFVILSAPRLSYDAVIAALENGDFYASTGIKITEISYEEGNFTVKTEGAVSDISFHTARRCTARVKNSDSASFSLSDRDKYVWAELKNNDGTTAYTRAYFLEELL